ncbi:MAG TPA: glycosyltransferase family 9 protein [Chitinophagaceae bacterium]|nr:glycosyltransferase family 9 protein [Chitinophagaceae bacterium]
MMQSTRFKIAILRALQLGDLLCAIPAVRSLRAAYPSAEITLLGLPWAASFVKRFNAYFDRFIHFPGYPGLPEQIYSPEAWTKFVQTMQEEQFDLVIQMQGNGAIVNPMLQSLRLKQLAGFHCAECRVDSNLFNKYPEHVHEAERYLMLMQHLGIPSTGAHLEFPLTEKDEEDFKKLLLPLFSKTYICVHPGSRGTQRQWPPAYFAALADYCIEHGFTVVLTGTNDEIDITKEVQKCMKHTAIDLTGKTSLGAVAVLIKNAFMLISNCTGVSHIAAAVETPSVVVSLDGEPKRWAPPNKTLHHVIDWTKNPHFEKVFKELVKMIDNSSNSVVKPDSYKANYIYS